MFSHCPDAAVRIVVLATAAIVLSIMACRSPTTSDIGARQDQPSTTVAEVRAPAVAEQAEQSAAVEPAPSEDSAPSEVIAWIKRRAVPLRTVEAGSGFADMAPIASIIGDAR
ncbi:MAG: hypothetical protein AAGC55_05465, partial [Myxococcota bacterium]